MSEDLIKIIESLVDGKKYTNLNDETTALITQKMAIRMNDCLIDEFWL